MAFWYDIGYFTPVIGRQMLNVFAGERGNAPANFGVRLEPGTIESALVEWRAERDAWFKENPELVEKLEKTIQKKASRS